MNQDDPTRSRRWVLHLDMDAFFASAEQLTRPTLRGRPVLVGGLGGRGVVAGASYEARVFGARSAMPMHQARRMVGGGAVVLPPRMSLYSVLSKRTFEALRLRMPILEQLSVDEAFGEPVELAGVGADEVRAFCEDLRALIKAETGLVASIGAGSGKQVAKIASGLAKPDGVAVIPPGMQHELLDPLPVRKLWGIGPVAEEKLKRLGIETIGGFARTPIAEVASILGTTVGPGLHRLAQGIDDRPVAERAESKQISAESTFAADIVTMAQLRAAVESSGRAAFSRLEKDGRAARTVVLKLKKSDMSILTRSVTLPFATIDRQILVATAQKQVIDPQELGPIRLVGVGFAGLSTVRQGSLFPELDQDVPGYPVETLTGALDEAELDAPVAARVPQRYWHPGLDVKHPEYGHGWVQGAGHGVVTVRFETRFSGTGIAKTFAESDEVLEVADAVDSLL
ncbi:DNA polymerase IV [Rhodococcus sp. NPDC059969]|uniref:DNA polymerase IV n=1 Tax=Rhodococcus sp. NPDC059969 TaxID=3347018 RepID=UPI00366B0293